MWKAWASLHQIIKELIRIKMSLLLYRQGFMLFYRHCLRHVLKIEVTRFVTKERIEDRSNKCGFLLKQSVNNHDNI